MMKRLCHACGEQKYFMDQNTMECQSCRDEREEGEMKAFVEELKDTLTLEERVERLEGLLYELSSSARNVYF